MPLRSDWPTRREFLHVMWPVSATKTSPPASIVAPPGPISNLARGAHRHIRHRAKEGGDRIGHDHHPHIAVPSGFEERPVSRRSTGAPIYVCTLAAI